MDSWQSLIIVTIVVGALLYILKLIPIDEILKRIVWVLIIVVYAIFAIRFLFTFIS